MRTRTLARYNRHGDPIARRNVRSAIAGSVPSGVHLMSEAQRDTAEIPARQILAATEDFERLAELVPVGLFKTDAQGNCVYANRRWRALSGLSLEQARGRGWVQAIHPEDRQRLLEQWLSAASQGQEFHSDYRLCKAPGETTWVSGRATAIRDEADEVIGYVGSVTDITERKLIEQSLQAKEAQLRLITDHTAVYITNCDCQRRLKFVNRSYAARLGLSPEQCLGRPIVEILGREAYSTFEQYIDRVLSGEAIEFEVEVPYKRLGTRSMHCSYVPERDASGEVVGWVAALTDVTERHLAEVARLRSEQRFAQFMRHLPGLAWIKDARGRYLYANEAFHEVFQMDKGELYGKTDFDLFPTAAARQFTHHDRLAATSANSAVQIIETLMHPDGKVHHSLVSKFMLTDFDGTSTLTAGIAIDVTDRLNAQEDLRQHKERLELAQQAGHIGSFEWNLQTGAVEWSATNEDLYGLEVGSFGGRYEDWKALLHPDDREQAVRDFETAVHNRTEIDSEFRIVRPDGEVRYIKSQARPHCDANGHPLRMVGVNVDVTPWRETEAALREADLRKNQFLATLAHELRNPLAPLCNALKLIELAGDDPGMQAEARCVMDRQINQLVHLVDDLLDVSRISRDKLALRMETVHLDAAIRGAVEATAPMFERMPHRLEVDLPDESILLHADFTRLVQIFTNLLVNAAKFTSPPGQIALKVALEDDFVVVSITDNGIGIPEEELPRVFDMFRQVDHSLERTKGGLGIGLTLVRRLVEMHGGTVTAHSPGVGQGSEFRVRLPRQIGPSADEPSAPAVTSANALTNRRILIADDNVDAAHSLATLFRMKGAITRVAHDGQEAVTAAEQFRPEAIVLDLGMPRLNGYDAARQIRQQPWGKAVLLMALSGWGQADDRQHSLDAGFDIHLVKPADLAVLEAFLRENLPPAGGP